MRCALSLGAAALSLAFAPAPLPRPPRAKAVLAQLQGELRRVSYVQYGQEHEPSGIRVVLVGDRLRYSARGTVTAEYAVTLDPASSPPHFDRRDTAAPGRILLGVYHLEGDTLTVRSASWGMPRPRALDDDRPGHTLTVFRRARR